MLTSFTIETPLAHITGQEPCISLGRVWARQSYLYSHTGMSDYVRKRIINGEAPVSTPHKAQQLDEWQGRDCTGSTPSWKGPLLQQSNPQFGYTNHGHSHPIAA